MEITHRTVRVALPPPPAAAVRPLPPLRVRPDITLFCRAVDPTSRRLIRRIYATLGESFYRECILFGMETPSTQVRIRFASQLLLNHSRQGLILIQDTPAPPPIGILTVLPSHIETTLLPLIRELLPL